MKIKLLLILSVLAFCWSEGRLNAQTTNDVSSVQAQLNDLAKRIQAKADTGKDSEGDYVDELKALEDLFTSEKSANTEAAARVLYLKGVFYLKVTKDYQKSLQIFYQVSTNYPETTVAGDAGNVAASLDRELSAQNIQENLVAGSKFPDFDEKDLDGNPLAVHSYAGKVVLVDFWATWCPPCRAELPNVIKTYKKYHADGFEIIGVSLDYVRPPLNEFLKANRDMGWPEYFDTAIEKLAATNPRQGIQFDNKLARKYGILSIPFNILIGPTGKIIAKNLRGRELGNTVKVALENK